MKNLLLLFALCSLIAACNSAPAVSAPPASGLPWPVSSPSQEGVDSLVLDSIHQDISRGLYGLVDRFLVIRNGKILVDHTYEQDYDSVMVLFDTTNYQYNYDHTDWHPYYRDTDLHTMQSVTKSVTSVLFGIAVDEGLIPGVDTSAMAYFTSYNVDLSDERKRAMTLEDLLTMRSGIEWDEENYDEANNSCILMENSDDWISFVLRQSMDTLPGRVFEYNSGASVLLGKIVREATGKRIGQWAEEKLFGPLDIDYYWKITPKGEVDTEGGLYLSTYDMAKIGYLMMNGGQWEGRQVVSKEWVEQSLKPTVQFNERRGYGYQWWIPEHQDGHTRIFAGNGYGGQFLMVVPEYELIVAFNGWQHHGRPEKSTWMALEERILPGVAR
ncbi:MAG: serine hydrolase [Phaeodactylibacter sp.]|nr:serine hydrolase [Phaeodactylibacter sp.]MCB9054174.1 serine hydrolase [Lewinellaceae bacterium]